MRPGALLLCVAIGAGLFGCSNSTGQTSENAKYAAAIQQGENPKRPESIALGIGGATYEVEVAGRGYGLSLGLMHRTKMGPDEGMWFEFPDEEIRKFWMRNTKIPLSIAFVTSEGTITNIEDMVPYVEQNTLSTRPAKYALEMNRGWFKKKGIEAGDTIRIGKVRKK